jgi:hypothetical protein
VRFHAINPSTSTVGLKNSPRTTMVIVGAGISLK